jgi:hypothetical protein
LKGIDMEKALWLTSFTSGTFDRLLDHCSEAGVTQLCIRTTSSALPNAIEKFKAHGILVYGWRWPAVTEGPHSAPHYFALDEAKFVAEVLIPAGLTGYIVDPESDGPGEVDDWNNAKHAALAEEFCVRIREAALGKFHFGVTSGCEYPRNHRNIPWQQFVAASDAIYPQAYWRSSSSGVIHGGTPTSSYKRAVATWKKIANGKPIIAIGGELSVALPTEIQEFGDLVNGTQQVAHFYADSSSTSPAILKAICAL